MKISKGCLRTQQLLQMVAMMVMVMVVSVGVVSGYPGGPPLASCGHMYPTGHKEDAKSIPPPYVLSATPTTIAAGGTVTLTLVATGDATYPYFEGVFVQARKASCDSETALGTFSVAQNDTFLKTLDCGGMTASAVSQKKSSHETNVTFTWTVPDQYQGRVFFRATVVKNKLNFWTNVFFSVPDLRKRHQHCTREVLPSPLQAG